MSVSLPRIIDAQKDNLLPLYFCELKDVHPPRVDLKDLIAPVSSSLLAIKPFRLPSKCYVSPLKKPKLQIFFQPQRVRRINRKQIEKGVLPVSLARICSLANVLNYVEARKIRKREQSNIKLETPKGLCMFLSRLEQTEFSVSTKSLLENNMLMAVHPQELERRVENALQQAEDLSGLRKLGYSGSVGIPRREEYLREFLAIRWFPEDTNKQRMMEEQANEHNPRITFTR